MTKWLQDSRLKQGIVIGLTAVGLGFAFPLLMGDSEAKREATEFLLSSAEANRRLGPNLRVETADLGHRWRFGWTPGKKVASYRLRAVGDNGTGEVAIRLTKPNAAEWQVHDATLWINQEAVRLK